MDSKAGGYWFIDIDNDGHWFVVPTHMRKQFNDWVDNGDEDPPDYAVEINGPVNSVVFSNWRKSDD